MESAFNAFEGYYKAGDTTIDIVGFSRGGALALEFANMIAEKYPEAQIRFMGLFDAVAAFGWPRDRINNGYRLYLPRIPVQRAVHAVAQNEYRKDFQCEDVEGALQVGFRGSHSDIGGTSGRKGLSNIVLNFMIGQARMAGVPLSNAYDNLPEDPSLGPYDSTEEASAILGVGPRKQPVGGLLLIPILPTTAN